MKLLIKQNIAYYGTYDYSDNYMDLKLQKESNHLISLISVAKSYLKDNIYVIPGSHSIEIDELIIKRNSPLNNKEYIFKELIRNLLKNKKIEVKYWNPVTWSENHLKLIISN